MHGSSTTLDYLKRAEETHRYTGLRAPVVGQPGVGVGDGELLLGLLVQDRPGPGPPPFRRDLAPRNKAKAVVKLLAPACDRGEGLLHAAAGRRREAARALRAAVGGFERLGVPFEAARTREHLATVGPAAAARSLLEAAGSTYERLGATPGHQAIRDRLLTLA